MKRAYEQFSLLKLPHNSTLWLFLTSLFAKPESLRFRVFTYETTTSYRCKPFCRSPLLPFQSQDHFFSSEYVGCFDCLTLMKPSEIQKWNWTDLRQGVGTTFLCPNCGVDSVLGDGAGYLVTRELLIAMKRRFKGKSKIL